MLRKHVVLLTSAIVVAALVGTSAVASAQRGERRHGFGPRGPFFTFGVDLTAEQREQIRAIVAEERQQRQDSTRTLNRQLEMELLADTPDQSRIDALKAQIAEAQQAALQHRIEIHQRVVQVLTPEQRAQARDRLAKAPERPARGRRQR